MEHPLHRVLGKANEFGVNGFTKIMTRTILTNIVNALPGHGLSVEDLIREDDWIGDSETVKKFRRSLRIQANMRFEDRNVGTDTSGKVSKEEFLRAYAARDQGFKNDRERHLAIVKERDEWIALRESRARAARKDLKEGTVAFRNLDEETIRVLKNKGKSITSSPGTRG